jgi:hypothetical protein
MPVSQEGPSESNWLPSEHKTRRLYPGIDGTLTWTDFVVLKDDGGLAACRDLGVPESGQ